MFKRVAILLLLGLVLSPVLAVQAQSAFDAAAALGAGISDGDLYVFTPTEAINLTQDGQGSFRQIEWRGNILAYSRTNADGILNLWLSVNGAAPIMLLDNIDPLYPFSFTADGLLVFAQDTRVETEAPFMTEVFTIAMEADAEPQPLTQIDTTIAVSPGCGGGSPIPTDWQYWTEAGFAGKHRILALTPYGLVYTLDCVGERTALLDLDTQETVELGENFGNVRLSPDRSHLLGLIYDHAQAELGPKLATLDLSTQQLQTYDTDVLADQVAWSSTGEDIYYTVRNALDEALPMTAEEQEIVNRSFGSQGENFGFPVYMVQIHRFNLSSNDDATLYTAPESAASIGRLFATHLHTLVFSQIPNLQDWIAALTAERFDLSSPTDSTALQLETVPVTALILDLETSELSTVGTNVNLFTPRS
ncbi:MAG: hypothetical protein K8L99_28930 [Anaerolineae bacterium]|nr:hypothetical protein [Anaerolineae bacterium]